MTARLTTCIVLSLGLFAGTSHARELRIVTEDTAYSYLRDDRVTGPASEVVEATLRRAGLSDYRIALYPWARAYDLALQEPDVLIYLIARTPEREALFQWVGEVMRIDYHLYRLREREDIQVRTLADARRYRVGVLREDVRHRCLQAQGFSKLVVVAHNADTFRLLLNGQVDLVPMPERDILTFSREAGVDPARLERVFTPDTPSRLYMAYSRQTEETVVARTRRAFDSLVAEGEVGRLMAEEGQ